VGGFADYSSKELSLIWKCVQVLEVRVYISRLRRRMPREGVVTKRRRGAQVWDNHEKAGTGVKRLESKGLESGLETECSSLRINIRISIDRLSGRLIEVALFLNKGMPAGTCCKLDVWTKDSNCTLVEIELGRLQGTFWSVLLSGSYLFFSCLELSCAVNLLSKQASVLFARSCRGLAFFSCVPSV
jgi:hypothetical protein